jgi:hypothetical protein
MKRMLMILAALALMAGAASAQVVVTYGWEDGDTVIGTYADIDASLATAPDPVHGGMYSLYLLDQTASGTPQAYVAYIWGLQDGDEVTACFWRWDDTPGASPSARIWGHWNDTDPPDPAGYSGSAGGNSDYGLGLGWDETCFTWTVLGHTGLVVEARTYSNPGDYTYVDDLTVTAPDHAWVQVPGFIREPDGTVISAESRTWGQVKALY